MKPLFPTKSILLTALCFTVGYQSAYAQTMYKWEDERGRVSFSDQVPPSKAELGHQVLDKNAQVIKVAGKAKTKAEIEMEKRLILVRKQQELILMQQKAHDKKLLSSFINLEAMDDYHKSTVQILNSQEQEMQAAIKKLGEEISAKQKEAAGYEIKNTKIPTRVLDKIAENQKKVVQTKEGIRQLQLKKLDFEKEFTQDRARYVLISQSNTSSRNSAPDTPGKTINQPGLFSCRDTAQCEKAWLIAKEFIKSNSVAKIFIDTDTLFMSEDPVSDTDLNLSISKLTTAEKKTEIFLDIRCLETVKAQELCTSPKADEIRIQFTDYLKEKLNSSASPAPAAPVSAPTPVSAAVPSKRVPAPAAKSK